MRMQSTNPMLRESVLRSSAREAATLDTSKQMSLEGTMSKTCILMFLALITATMTYTQVHNAATEPGYNPAVLKWIGPSALAGLVVYFIAIWKPTLSPILAPIYALIKGVALGAISAVYAVTAYPNIVLHAVLLTFTTAFGMFAIWRSGIIPMTNKFMSVVGAAFMAIFLTYIVTWLLGSFFDMSFAIHGNGPVGIGFSLVVIVVVSLMLMVDFEQIKRGSQAGAPAYMEWYFGLVLLVTLIWLYYQILHLLNALRD